MPDNHRNKLREHLRVVHVKLFIGGNAQTLHQMVDIRLCVVTTIWGGIRVQQTSNSIILPALKLGVHVPGQCPDAVVIVFKYDKIPLVNALHAIPLGVPIPCDVAGVAVAVSPGCARPAVDVGKFLRAGSVIAVFVKLGPLPWGGVCCGGVRLGVQRPLPVCLLLTPAV